MIIMSLIPYRSSFTILASIDDILPVLDNIEEFIKTLSFIKIIETTSKGIVCELSYRKRLSKLKDKWLVTIRRLGRGSINITAIGSKTEVSILIKAVPEELKTRIDINATARGDKPGLIKDLLARFSKEIEKYIKEKITKPVEKPVEKRREVKAVKKEEKPVPLTEFVREKEASPPKPVERPVVKPRTETVVKPLEAKPKPVVEEVKPKPPSIEIPSRSELEKKLRDPIWIAQLLMNASLITRKVLTLPSSPKELFELVEKLAGGELGKYPVIMLSIRGEDIDAHIIYDPANKDIKASKTTIGGILDYTGEEALKKLFEKKQATINLKIWGIKKIP